MDQIFITNRRWYQRKYAPDAYYSSEYGGLLDDEFYWYFKKADPDLLKEVFTLLKNGGAMLDFKIEKHEQPFSSKVVSYGFRVWPLGLDLAFMNIDSIEDLLQYYFKERGVELHHLTYHKLLNLKPKWNCQK